jgi:hypothetical protein
MSLSTPPKTAKDAHSSTGSSTPPTVSPPPPEEPQDEDNDEPTTPDLDPEPEPEPDHEQIRAEAEKLKEQGNDLFKRGRYGEAIDLYTKALGTSSEPS